VVRETPVERTENGVTPAGDGWLVVNARDARWFETDGCGFYASFEGENTRFTELGVGLGILRPGEPSAMYHGEDAQEDFLVLAGECLLLIEGEERRLRAWDFVHCPPWAEHIFVGAGVEEETSDPKEAYARFGDDIPVPCPDEFPRLSRSIRAK
jgi:glyoxylate utilization-related uncharacterized protein